MRERFARDLDNLTLATPALNRHQKGAKGATDWLPELNRCWFAETVIAVRQEYELTIDQLEVDATSDARPSQSRQATRAGLPRRHQHARLRPRRAAGAGGRCRTAPSPSPERDAWFARLDAAS